MVQTIKIGHSDVASIKLGLGTNKVGGHNLFPGLEDEDGYDLVQEALSDGISLLDTAYVYGLGKSEEIIGDVLQKNDRQKVIVASKAAQDPKDNLKLNNKPAFLKQAVDDALKRLKTDYIDIFYIHFPDDQTDKAEAVAALADEKKAGKIRAVGVSNFSLDQVKEANVDGQVDIVEDNYSLLHRGAEKDLLPYLKANGISFVPYFPLASGLLTGKYTAADAGKFDQFSAEQFDRIIKALDQVRQIADKKQATVAQVMIAWYMADPDVSVVIPGARKAEQVKSNAAALSIDISDKEFKTIDQLFAGF